jgi:hypothetical protein
MALSNATFSDLGGAVSDLFAASGARTKAQGDLIEAQNYGLAAALAGQNVEFEKVSTNVKEAQADREIFQTTSSAQANEASSGFAEAGSAIDILRDSASQGALQKAVLGQQGLIQEAAYTEQQQSYLNMQTAANMAASAENNNAFGLDIASGLKAVAAVATLVPGIGAAGTALAGAVGSSAG